MGHLQVRITDETIIKFAHECLWILILYLQLLRVGLNFEVLMIYHYVEQIFWTITISKIASNFSNLVNLYLKIWNTNFLLCLHSRP